LAGISSPLVASLHYILSRATSKKHTLEGVNAYSVSVNAGYAFGSVVVGLGYDDLGWFGLNVLSAVVAGVAMVTVLALVKSEAPAKRSPSVLRALGELPSLPEKGDETFGSPEAKKKKKATSVWRTGAMASHAVTAVNVGYQFMGFLVLFTLMAKQILGWSATTLGWSFMAIPIVNSLVMYYVIPPLIARFGVHALITYSSMGTMLTLGAFAVPAVHTSPAGVMLVTVCLVLCVVTVQVPNQMRIKLIADAFAPRGDGENHRRVARVFRRRTNVKPDRRRGALHDPPLVSHRVDVSRRGDGAHRVLPVRAGILRGPGREGSGGSERGVTRRRGA